MATQLPLLPRSHNFHVEARQWARHHLKPWDVETGGLSSLLNCMNLHQVVSEPVSPPQAAVTVSLVLAVRVAFPGSAYLCAHAMSCVAGRNPARDMSTVIGEVKEMLQTWARCVAMVTLRSHLSW